MESQYTLIVLLFTLITQVLAHGYLKSVAIDGTTYEGNVPDQTPSNSPIRLIDSVEPVKGASNPNLSCGQDAQNAALVVPANPGSQVAFSWASGGGGNWPHNTGPLMTYMAVCDGTTCDKFDASNARWFKIDEAGQKSDSSGWVQADIMNGQSYSITLPSDIAAGDYLIRHEIIALQGAVSVGGAEFYPSCTQVRVGGNNDGAPNATVSFPGAYSDTDPGILTPNVYNPGFEYVFPGPPIASIGSGNGNNAVSNSDAPPAPSSTAPTSSALPSSSASISDVPTSAPGPSPTSASTSVASPSSSSTSNSGSCGDWKSNDNWARDTYRPRRFVKTRRSGLH
ncbi:glycosyl hydrolase family 61-domain-containing protein [Dichomitus squalens]|uniref:lytic cellulose monooxygenase (C4-dehydrogenating) n=1 Tax=Dichomitus squalens TaxID=114155 RepID=A0A4Q9PZX2_9APHY|nr:glycosyl hydrolase family 61-domain-containing protein [Dichomitus squalens]TBU60239.1 glycosyl hydrolase family 61-domain-containing protein [Dichomitus squalens]